MKRLLTLLILLFALPAYAQQCSEETPCPELARLSPAMLGSTPSAAAGTFTYVQSVYGTGAGTIATSVGGAGADGKLTVLDGDLLVAFAATYTADDTAAITAISDGTNTYDLYSQSATYAHSIARFGYKANAAAAAASVVTVTLTGTASQTGITVVQFRPSVVPATTDKGPGMATGATANPTSGAVTTSATGGLIAVTGSYNINGDTPSAVTIGGNAATKKGTHTSIGYLVPASNTSITGVFTLGAINWHAGIVTFKD